MFKGLLAAAALQVAVVVVDIVMDVSRRKECATAIKKRILKNKNVVVVDVWFLAVQGIMPPNKRGNESMIVGRTELAASRISLLQHHCSSCFNFLLTVNGDCTPTRSTGSFVVRHTTNSRMEEQMRGRGVSCE
jgi:hypothetical protein